MADLFIIGHFNGVDSKITVFISSKVMHIITVMIVTVDMGFTIMIAHSVGANKHRQTNEAIGNTATCTWWTIYPWIYLELYFCRNTF